MSSTVKGPSQSPLIANSTGKEVGTRRPCRLGDLSAPSDRHRSGIATRADRKEASGTNAPHHRHLPRRSRHAPLCFIFCSFRPSTTGAIATDGYLGTFAWAYIRCPDLVAHAPHFGEEVVATTHMEEWGRGCGQGCTKDAAQPTFCRASALFAVHHDASTRIPCCQFVIQRMLTRCVPSHLCVCMPCY